MLDRGLRRLVELRCNTNYCNGFLRREMGCVCLAGGGGGGGDGEVGVEWIESVTWRGRLLL